MFWYSALLIYDNNIRNGGIVEYEEKFMVFYTPSSVVKMYINTETAQALNTQRNMAKLNNSALHNHAVLYINSFGRHEANYNRSIKLSS